MISAVMSTYQRGHYLDRSLHCYASAPLSVPLELVIIDDGSTDDTAAIVERWAQHLDITYLRLWKQPGLWRDCAATINRGIRAARGDLIIATHPEVMPGTQSLQVLWDARTEQTYLACKIYYLTPDDQARIDTVPWRDAGASAVRQLPGFYAAPSAETRGHPDYSHEATDHHTTWESWVFGGFTRSTWRWVGGFSEFTTWGSIDVDFLTRRQILGIPTLVPMSTDTICVHQNHDVPGRATDVPTPRDMDACMAALSHYPTKDSARKGYI